jgi:F-type H+-transporting ATPase subunit alpha
MPVEEQVAIIWAVTNGYLDAVEVKDIRQWESDFLEFLRSSHAPLLQSIKTKKELDDSLTTAAKAAVAEFAPLFKPAA